MTPLWLGVQCQGHFVSRPDRPSPMRAAHQLERYATVLCIYEIWENTVAELKMSTR